MSLLSSLTVIIVITWCCAYNGAFGRSIVTQQLPDEDPELGDIGSSEGPYLDSDTYDVIPKYILEALHRQEYPGQLSKSFLKSLDIKDNADQEDIQNVINHLKTEAKKRGFDSIEHLTDFGGFSKRGFDPIEHLTNFGGFSKRGFNPIEHLTNFGGFSKHGFDPIEHLTNFEGFSKRGFNPIEHLTNFGGFSKRGFDSIEHLTDFGGFSKRGGNYATGLKKRGFDSIEHMTDFGKFRKRNFDPIEHFTDFGNFAKRGLGSIEDMSDSGHTGKRSFDSIEHSSLFGGFGKRDNVGKSKSRIKSIKSSPRTENQPSSQDTRTSWKSFKGTNNQRLATPDMENSEMTDSEQMQVINRLLSYL